MNSFVKATPLCCIGCRTCMIACVVAHEGKRIFEIDPDGYNFNPRLFMVKTAKLSAPIQCRHCENAACMHSCTSGAISIKEGIVFIDTEKCIGCKNCVMACPFGAVEVVETAQVNNGGNAQHGESNVNSRKVANKCDLCKGSADSPQCVRVCPTEALKLVTEECFDETMTDKRKAAINSVASEA
ncbi:MAG: 4Fe-4S dicluster domain-containing protein [Termitinemataceae bacterium]|nr:MAG: 4Fe-4S dicluster domain-containing protein [Termitinemataceae bacterium]